MLKFIALAGVAALVAAPVLAQPSPGEQQSMHVGSAATNGSSTIVTDAYGTHPEGYPGMSVVNRTSAAHAAHRGHHHRHAYRSDGGR